MVADLAYIRLNANGHYAEMSREWSELPKRIDELEAERQNLWGEQTTLSVRNVNPVLGGYAASKGSLTTAARALAVELGPHRIRVNCVAPGHIWGESLRVYFEWQAERRGVSADDVYREVAGQSALDHIATPDEIAGPVAWFASDRSRVVTGQTLDVSCGRTVG